MRDFDAIVIGSGAGGLNAAVALSNVGKRVLVLEQHYIAGGWCHSFVLDSYRFSPGVHYVGELAPGQSLRRTYEGLGVANDLEFCQLNEDGYDHFIVGSGAGGEVRDARFDVPAGVERFRERMLERFPRERAGVEAFFDLMVNVSGEFGALLSYAKGPKALLLPYKARHLLWHGARLLGPWLDRHLEDPVLRAFLTAQAGDYGVAPSEAPILMHAGLMGHYFSGAYYPRGGAYRLPRAYIRRLKHNGGSLRLSAAVKRILVQGGRAVGVELDGGEQLFADVVISNADPEMTYRKLVGEEHLSASLRRKLARTTYGPSSLALFLATDLDLKGMGYDSGNYWFYASPDIDGAYRTAGARMPRPGEADDGGLFDGCFVTITTLKDPSKRTDGRHTLEVFAIVPWEPFAPFADDPFGERTGAYKAYKDVLAKRLLRTAERVIPGLSAHLEFMEVGTPVTNAHYCAAHEGACYGITKSRRQLGPGSYPLKTEIPGLYMVGASTLSHGVAGATMTGVLAASRILGCSVRDLYTQRHEQSLTLYPSERPDAWLESLRQRRNADTTELSDTAEVHA